MKIDKKDIILNSIIKAYLDQNSPIGSAELRNLMGEIIPASTIRVYFKKLSLEGAITQLHISSGRIPTIATMQEYWKKTLNFDDMLYINDLALLEKIVKRFDVFCMIYSSDNEILHEVINYEDRFIILVFDKDEIILKYSEKIFKILSNLKNIGVEDLQIASMQIGFNELRDKLKGLKHSKIDFIANEAIAFEIFDDGKFINLFDPSAGIYLQKHITFSPLFDDGFMGIKRPVILNNQNATMICAGSVYRNFNKFFQTILEAI